MLLLWGNMGQFPSFSSGSFQLLCLQLQGIWCLFLASKDTRHRCTHAQNLKNKTEGLETWQSDSQHSHDNSQQCNSNSKGSNVSFWPPWAPVHKSHTPSKVKTKPPELWTCPASSRALKLLPYTPLSQMTIFSFYIVARYGGTRHMTLTSTLRRQTGSQLKANLVYIVNFRSGKATW